MPGEIRSKDLQLPPQDRAQLIRRGLSLSIITVIWNIVEGIVAVASGIFAGSVALIGFGVDSFIETASAVIVGWRFSYEINSRSRERAEKAERLAARLAGFLLLALAAYLLVESGRRLLGFGPEPTPSKIGIVLTFISLIIMPVLGLIKLRVAGRLQSKALRADSYETITCAWMSATTLVGLVVNATLGWWWADPLAALVLVPLIVREGLEGLRGESD
jgi:cation diffusion facilitator family transporter